MAKNRIPCPPKVDPLVPTHALDWKLGQTHVGTPDAEVIRMVEDAIAQQTDPRWTATIKRQTVRYALWRHHLNQSEYRFVMGGR